MTRRGFTLIELLLAVSILAVVAALAAFTLDAGVRSWRVGTETADRLHHADVVVEQLVMGLRSAYYPDANRPSGAYGFQMTDNGEGPDAQDSISWVKLGTALVGADASYAGTPHRVVVGVRGPDSGDDTTGGGLNVSAWRIDAQPEDFDPAKDVTALNLTPRVVGFNCRMVDPEQATEASDLSDNTEIEWLDTWEDDYTNRLPFAVELTLYMEPPLQGQDPIEIKRIVELPLAPLSWVDKGGLQLGAGGIKASGGGAGRERSTSGRGGNTGGNSGHGGTGADTGRAPDGSYTPRPNTSRVPRTGGTGGGGALP